MKKFILVGYVILMMIEFVWAMIHMDDTDENGYGKVQWRFIILLIMLTITPFIAKFSGLI